MSQKEKEYNHDARINILPDEVKVSFQEFWNDIKTIEREQKVKPILFQDQKSGAFYVECHILASVVGPLLDINAALDPEEQEEYRANRPLQPQHRAFLQMLNDAKNGRQFSDLIIEYNKEHEPTTKPLKVLGGQHRIIAITEALQKSIERPHGFKVYFALSMEQRNEITQVSNTNIVVPTDLLDRMQETMLRSGLRDWCQKIGLLKQKEDFADRKNSEGIITVKVARSFLVNFFEGKKIAYNSNKLYTPYLCHSSIGGTIDEKYDNLQRNKKIWGDKKLIDTGKVFAELHKKQMVAISKDPKLSKIAEFKTKAITPVVTAAWAMIAGSLNHDNRKLKKLFSLNKTSNQDPLNTHVLSTARHHSDPDNYRGIGARISKEELGRMAEVIIQFIESSRPVITKQIVDAALKSYHAKVAAEDAEKAKRKI